MVNRCHTTEAYVLEYTSNNVLFYDKLPVASIAKFLHIKNFKKESDFNFLDS